MDELAGVLEWLIGEDGTEVGLRQMAVRAFIVYVAALIMVRLGDKRFIGENTALDVILGIILGSVLSRAINGSARFFPTLFGSLFLVLLHWSLAWIAFRSDRFDTLVKGQSRRLIKNGELQRDELAKSHITEKELQQAARQRLHAASLEEVKDARLEPSGAISLIPQPKAPRILEVEVAEGVQTIHVVLE